MDNKITTVIFDFDGTLADTFELRVSSWKTALHDTGIACPIAQLEDRLREGHDNRSILKIIFRHSLSPDIEKKVLALKHYWRHAHETEIKLFPEVAETLRFLKRKGYRIIIFSQNRESIICQVLEREGLRDLVSEIVAAPDDIDEIEWNGSSLENFLTDIGVSKSEVLYIGDTPADEKRASDLTIGFLGIARHGYSAISMKKYGIRTLSDIFILSPTLSECNLIPKPIHQDFNFNEFDLEYDNLKKEILQYQQLRFQVMSITVGAMGVLMGLPFLLERADMPGQFIFLARATMTFIPLLLLIPSCYFTYLLSRNTTILGSYILVFHEGLLRQPGWEFARHEMDSASGGLRESTRKHYSRFYILLGIFAFLYCLFLSLDTVERFYPWGSYSICAVELKTILIIIFTAIDFVLGFTLINFATRKLSDATHIRKKNEFLRFWIKAIPSLDDAQEHPIQWIKGKLGN